MLTNRKLDWKTFDFKKDMHLFDLALDEAFKNERKKDMIKEIKNPFTNYLNKPISIRKRNLCNLIRRSKTSPRIRRRLKQYSVKVMKQIRPYLSKKMQYRSKKKFKIEYLLTSHVKLILKTFIARYQGLNKSWMVLRRL